MTFSLYLISSFLVFGLSSAQESPVVQTSSGKVQGYVAQSYNGHPYLAFEGIPYAKPPIGDKRFEEPEPIDPWDDVLNATAVTSCIILLPGVLIGEEDCLHLNVYVPREKINPDEKLEVIFYIHGGGFTSGSGNLLNNPWLVVERDVIFVTFNYRLTVFGFLSTENDVVPGNNGLKDQALAMKWVKENIEKFGGNSDSITATGLSAGSASVHLHYFSERSKGLFHRGICQSGSALNPFATVRGNLKKANMLGETFGCSTSNTKVLIDCLKEISAEKLIEAVALNSSLAFGPVVEKAGTNPFISDYPYNLLVKGEVQDLPLVASNVIHEGLVLVADLTEDILANLEENWNGLAASFLSYEYTIPESSWAETAEKIRQHWFGNKTINDPDNYFNLIQTVSERYFVYDGETGWKIQSNVTQSPVYYFTFAYPGEDNPLGTVPHGVELFYMFNNAYFGKNFTENDIKMKDLLWDMVISFAKTGTPSFGDIEWEPTTYEENKYLYISGVDVEGIEKKTAKQITDREFWTSLKFNENEHLAQSSSASTFSGKKLSKFNFCIFLLSCIYLFTTKIF